MTPDLSLPRSPRRTRGGRRVPGWIAGTVLGLQALLWGGGSILEARAAAESLTRYSHVEDINATKCPPIHSHLDCLVCRTFSGGAVAGAAPPVVEIPNGGECRPQEIIVAASDRALRGLLGSRAPPRA